MSPSWSSAERILCVRLDGLGDVLMSTPAIRALRQPGRRLALLTSPAGAALDGLLPEVDEVLTYVAPWMKVRSTESAPMDLEMIEQLRSGGFDAAVIFSTYSQSPLPAALLCYLAGIPLRLAHCHENPYQLLTNWVPDPEPVAEVRHEVRRQLALVATIGARTTDERLSLRIPPAAGASAAGRLRTIGVDLRQPFVALHPGASAASRRYAPDRFAAAADEIARRTRLPLVLLGGPHDVDLVRKIRHTMRTACAAAGPDISLAELASTIAHAAVLVCNNSAPAHIASALGTPVVDLYALTNPQHTPWQVPCRVLSHDVPCRNCLRSVCPFGHNACLQAIPPEAVADAACELLAECA